MSNLALYRQPQGLGGWWGRQVQKLARAVLKIAEKIPVIGVVVAAANESLGLTEMINDDNNWNWRAVDTEYSPTSSEMVILTEFSEKLKPFYFTLSNDLSSGLLQTSIAEKILITNSCLNRMAVVKAYFASNETEGLTKDGILSRNEIILKVFQPLHDVINQKMVAESLSVVPVTITINQSIADQFSGLISGQLQTSYSSQNYRENSTGTPSIPGAVINLPTLPAPVKGNSGIVPTKQDPKQTDTGSEKETGSGSFLKKAAIVGILAAVAYAVFGGSSTPKKPAAARAKNKPKKVTI